MLRPGERIGDWIVEKPLGEGGMGAVYRVHSALTQRLVAALKVMKPSAEPDSRARFVREAEALAALRHPAVVRVMEFAEDDSRGLLYLVMELALGETLRQRIERGTMELREALGTFLPLAQGLDHAHAAGVFHRDLKPSNIVLCHDGTVRLVDFGIAAAQHAEPLTNTGQLGTLAYLPPEVFKGEHTEPQAVDVYAFGLLLHEALTGQRSFPVDPGLTPAAAAAAVGVRKLQSAPLELPEQLPERLRDLVRRATDPDPGRRPTMSEIRGVLETLVERRASADAAGPHPRLVPLAPVSASPDEHTMRVPDPTDTPVAAVPRSGIPRRVLVAGILVLLALAAAAMLVARVPQREPLASAADSQAGQGAGAPPSGQQQPPAAYRPGTVVAPPAARGAPAASQPLPASSPGSASPPPRSAPAAGPPGATAPQSAEPEEAADDGDAGMDDSATEPVQGDSGPESVSLGGRWELTHEIEATSHAPYAGLRLGYRLTLEQDGNRVFGRGRKYMENGVLLPPERRTSITVDGRLEGQYLVLQFVEQGAWRTSTGTIRWLVSPGAGSLQGRFASDAAQSSGASLARRLR